jgi:hypothetical protein
MCARPWSDLRAGGWFEEIKLERFIVDKNVKAVHYTEH